MSPSSEALNSGNFCNVATAALIMKASIDTRTPLFSFSLFNCTRKPSRSVMSASSWLVTCGISTQLRCRLAPEIFLIRDSGLASIGPNLAKSTFGHGRRSMPPTLPEGAAAGAAFADGAGDLANASTSSFRMRPLLPLPVTLPRSTPSSRASLRTPGPA